MDLHKLAKSDLNLIVAFQVLIEEKSVSRAAERLFISQSAMSKTLNRLRVLFDDPLFTRTSFGLIPTPRAEILHRDVPGILSRVEQLITAADFDPRSFKGVFRLACSDSVGFLFPSMMRELARLAPGVKIEIVQLNTDIEPELRLGNIDFAIHNVPVSKPDIESIELGTSHFVCVMRAAHPLANRRKLTLRQFLTYPHVRYVLPNITSSGLDLVDEPLARLSLTRHVILDTPYLDTALGVVSGTDCLFTLAHAVEHNHMGMSSFHHAKLPDELAVVGRTMDLLYHRRCAQSPAHMWLVEQIRISASASR